MKHIKLVTNYPRPASWWEVRQMVEIIVAVLTQIIDAFRQISGTKDQPV